MTGGGILDGGGGSFRPFTPVPNKLRGHSEL